MTNGFNDYSANVSRDLASEIQSRPDDVPDVPPAHMPPVFEIELVSLGEIAYAI